MISLLLLSLFLQSCTPAALTLPSNTHELKRRPASVPHHQTSSRRQTAGLDGQTGADYLLDVTIGKQTFELQIDTGSSDTWVVNSTLDCHGQACPYGKGYQYPGTFQKVPGVYLNASYGDGTEILGLLGHETVTVAGIAVPNQVVSIVSDTIKATSDGISSGIIGLGFPALTRAYEATTGARVQYDPIVTNMFKAGLVKNQLFTLALTTTGGTITFGGLPEGVSRQSQWGVAPLLQEDGMNQRYIINADWTFPGSNKLPRSNLTSAVIIDSGSTVNSVPTAIAAAVNAQFQPAATLGDSGTWFVDCNAKAPPFGIVVGGVKFLVNPVDMLRPEPNGQCSSTVTATNGDAILGDSWMRSVVAVFDVGNKQLQFTKA